MTSLQPATTRPRLADTLPAPTVVLSGATLLALSLGPLLEAAGIRVLATVTDPAMTVEVAMRWHPDVLVVLTGGAAAAWRHVPLGTQPSWVLVVGHPGELTGVDAHLSPDAALADLAKTIRGLATRPRGNGGRSQVRLARRVPQTPQELARLCISGLTRRERQILEALIGGGGTAEIARELGISTNTVRTHLHNLFGKLGVHSRLEAVTFMRRHQLHWTAA